MDSKLKDHAGPLLANLERRLFLRRGLSLGALSLLAGCELGDKLTYDANVQKLLTAMSRWNDGVQSWLFDPKRLAPEYGFPMKLRIPTKLGFKNPKHIAAIFVTNENPGGYWEDKGYNWFSGS